MWYILKQLFTSVSVKVMDIYLAASQLGEYPSLFTSTSVNNCSIFGVVFFVSKSLLGNEGQMSSLVRISMTSLISSLSLKLYLNSLVYDRNIFGSSSKVFSNLRNFRKILGNVRAAFGQILWNLRKSSESGRKSSENRQTLRHHYVYKEHYTLARRYEFYVHVARTISHS